MAKLYFKYGVVNSSKSANALMTIHNYEEQGMRVYVIKPSIDTRDLGVVKSRAINESRDADLLAQPSDDLLRIFKYNNVCNYDVVIVDECQFLTVKQINQLREIVNNFDIPIICYGLKTDFKTKLFASSKRLFELADSVSEIKTVCSCGSKAIFNARLGLNGDMIFSGEQIKVGGNELYRPVCSKCYFAKLNEQFKKSDIHKELYKSFIENKSYLESLVNRLDKNKEDRGTLLNDVIRADYYIKRLISKCSDLDMLEQLEEIQSCFEAVLESTSANDLLRG